MSEIIHGGEDAQDSASGEIAAQKKPPCHRDEILACCADLTLLYDDARQLAYIQRRDGDAITDPIPLPSSTASRLIMGKYHQATTKDAKLQAVKEAMEALCARASVDGERIDPPDPPTATATDAENTADALLDQYHFHDQTPPEIREKIDLDQLLDDVRSFIVRYMVFRNSHQSVSLVLWVAHTYAIDASDITPYVRITAATKEAGKSRLLEILALLACDAWLAGSTTVAAMVRVMAEKRPTVLLDETDAAFAGDKERAQALRGILNNGYARDKQHYMCDGPQNEAKAYDVFGAKAFAGIGGMPDTVESRCIVQELQRKAPGEKVERFRQRLAQKKAAPITERLGQWATRETIQALREYTEAGKVELPSDLSDRQQDIWEPLLAIADMAGKEWPELARNAADALSARSAVDDGDSLARLLADIRTIFTERGSEVHHLASADLAQSLAALEESPWGSRRSEEALCSRRLAALLRPLKIKPKGVRIGNATPKGYEATQFRDAWLRYLPPPQHPQHRNNPDISSDSAATLSATSSATSTDAEPEYSAPLAGVAPTPCHTSATVRIGVPEKSLFDGHVADVALVAAPGDADQEVFE